jgi:hypothetical protein
MSWDEQSPQKKNEAKKNFCNNSNRVQGIMKLKHGDIYLVKPANFVRKSLKSFDGDSASRYT